MDFRIVGVLALLVAFSAAQKVMPYKFSDGNEDPEYANPDKYGFRYCASWKLADGTTLFSDCDPYKFRRCGKVLDYEYKCCTGFKEVDSSIFPAYDGGERLKCAKVVPQWDFCPNVIQQTVGYSVFANQLKFGNFMELSDPVETHTIFAPHTENENTISELYGDHTMKKLENPAMIHVVKYRYYAKELKDGMELTSIYKNYPLKVSKYSFGVICIECAEIMEADLECKTGLVHFIRRPIVPQLGLGSKDRTSLLRALETDDRTTSFAASLPSDLRSLLSDVNSGQWYTVYPVENTAWDALKETYSAAQLGEITRNHVVKGMFCSAAIYRMTSMKTLSGERINVGCDTKGNYESRYIYDACRNRREFIEADVMARNGVGHVIDGPLVPVTMLSIKEVLKKCADAFNIGKFSKLIADCDLRIEEGKKYAMYFPVDYAFKWWAGYKKFSSEYNRFMNDKQYRCRVARYHINAYNDQLSSVDKLGHEQEGFRTNNPDKLFEVDYFLKDGPRSELYFHYSPNVGFESQPVKEGSMYRINRINVVPEKLMIDIINEHPNLTTTKGQVNKIDMNNTVYAPNEPLNLFLATVDDGFVYMNGSMRKELSIYKGDKLKKFLLLHHIPLYLWGGDIGYFKNNTVHKFMSSAGVELIFHMDNNGVMRIGYEGLPKNQWALVIEWNLHAKDGIIWLLKNFLPCPPSICPLKKIDRDYYDVFVSACMYMDLGGVNQKSKYTKKPLDVTVQFPEFCTFFREPTYVHEKEIPA